MTVPDGELSDECLWHRRAVAIDDEVGLLGCGWYCTGRICHIRSDALEDMLQWYKDPAAKILAAADAAHSFSSGGGVGAHFGCDSSFGLVLWMFNGELGS